MTSKPHPRINFFGGSLPLSRSHRHCYREPKLFQESGRDAASHDRLQYFDGIEQAQLGSSDDGHSDGNVFFALCCPVAKSDFPEKDTVADPGLRPVVCGLNRRIFEEDEEFVFMGYQPFADVVGFVVRQWRMPVQHPEPFENCLSAGTVFFGSQNGVLIMKKNSLLNKLFKSLEECLGIRVLREFIVENRLDIAEQMRTAFLFGEGSGLVPVGVVKVANQNAVVKFPEMVNNHFGSATLINMEEGDLRIGKNPKPVALPAGLIGMNVRRQGERLFQGLVKRRSFFSKFVVESDDGSGRDSQSAKMLKRPLGVVIRNFDFMAKERSHGSCLRPDKGIGNFVLAPAMDNAFATGTPVITMNKACRGKLAGLKVFLDMLCSMVAWRNVLAFAKQTPIKINVNSFVNDIRFLAKMALVSKRSAQFLRIFRRLFLFIFFKGSLERLSKFCLKLGSGFFKFLDLPLKFPDLEIGKVHGKLKVVNAFAKISSFRQNCIGRFAFEKYAEFVERAKRMFAWIMVLFFLPAHGLFPNINIIATSKHKETHPALETAG
jgi:hypothetical protein